MHLFPPLEKQFSNEQYTAKEAQYLAYLIAFGPSVFQTARLMLKYGIFELLQQSDGMTRDEIAKETGLSDYAAKCLLEASLTMGTILIDTKTDRFTLSKTGWFLLNDDMLRADIDFNHDVNYEGWFHLDKALEEGRPAGLEHFGDWPTIYEGLSRLPEKVQKSWFGFDHFYSDHSFDEALAIIFSKQVKTLLDVGGNTGRFAMRVVGYDENAQVTICDLPQQLEIMRKTVEGRHGANRICGYGMNLLDENTPFPTDRHYDIIWMSQFLDCFAEQEIVSILNRAAKIMDSESRLLIMETLWDRQKYAPAAMALTQTSLYFTALANGNSKMYNTDDMSRLIALAGLEIEHIHDYIGRGGHSIIVCKTR